MTYREDVSFDVTITIKLKTRVSFAPMERETKITQMDAIANAVGSMPEDTWEAISTGFGGEFAAPVITYEAVEAERWLA